MRISKTRIYAIVTGDVIASSSLSSPHRRNLHKAMSQSSAAVRRAFRSVVPVPVDIFRGDSWQLLVTDPALSLRASLFYRASLRARMGAHRLDTRMVIAVGGIDFLPGDRVSEGDGVAYRLSGTEVETMPKRETMRFVYPGHASERALGIVVHLIDGLASRWSDKQARAVTGALRGWKQGRIAKSCWDEPISQQAVAQHLDRAGWGYIESAIDYVEETLRDEGKKQA